MAQEHTYEATIVWTGNRGEGTAGYRSYERSYDVVMAGKATLKGTADPAFRGDAALHNPEDLLLASVSACHMLWYLHLAAEAGISVLEYRDRAAGVMQLGADGGGRFTRLILRPEIAIAPGGDLARAQALHAVANARCFIANSLNLPVEHEPVMRVAAG